ncbi:MAG: cytochrome c family protein [Alphaproteobacteria bacterium]
MASLEGNKIAAAVLVSGITAMLAGFISEIVFEQHAPEEQAYPIAVSASEATADTSPPEPLSRDEILTLIASADIVKGERIAKKCASCHTFTLGGKDGIGPNLWNIVNQPVGRNTEFSYSDALEEHAEIEPTWGFDSLFHFLQSPRKYIKGTKMSFAGLSKEQDRADIIEYLRNLSDTPSPVE